MTATWAIYKRELALYFRSPIAYAVAFALLLFFGLLFSANVSQAVQANVGGQAQFNVTALNNLTPQLLTFLMFLVAPLLTMRLLAEESREGTLETLMTLPISDTAVVLGKFFAVWSFYTVILVLAGSHTLLLTWIGTPDWGQVAGLYLGAWLYGGAVLAVALIFSAITDEQIVAAFLGAAAILLLYLSDTAAQYISTLNTTGQNATLDVLANFFRQLGLPVHYNTTMLNGIIRLHDVLYFVCLMVGALFITVRLLETRRWRG